MEAKEYSTTLGKRYHFDNVYHPYMQLSKVQLVQAGELIVGDGYLIPEHVQVCMEISYVVSGHCDFYTDSQVFHAKAGDIHVISQGKRHQIVAGSGDNLRMAYVGFLFQEEAGEALAELKQFFENPPLQLKNEQNQIKALFEKILTELYISMPYGKEVIDSCMNQILVQVFRSFSTEGFKESPRIVEEARMNRIVGHTIVQALRYIDSNIMQITSISQVAEQLKYNPAYLSRIFHEKTGITMSEYIAQKKIEIAKSLLASGKGVGETAQVLGYASSQSFCKMFRRYTKSSPSVYRHKQE